MIGREGLTARERRRRPVGPLPPGMIRLTWYSTVARKAFKPFSEMWLPWEARRGG